MWILWMECSLSLRVTVVFLKNGKEIKSQSDCKRNGEFNDPQRGDVAKPANTLELIK